MKMLYTSVTERNTMENTQVRPSVKLLGRDGNAFVIMGACQSAARKAGWTKEQIDAVLNEMQSGDYNHLLATAMKFFDVE
jgi:hypothetical protein